MWVSSLPGAVSDLFLSSLPVKSIVVWSINPEGSAYLTLDTPTPESMTVLELLHKRTEQFTRSSTFHLQDGKHADQEQVGKAFIMHLAFQMLI